MIKVTSKVFYWFTILIFVCLFFPAFVQNNFLLDSGVSAQVIFLALYCVFLSRLKKKGMPLIPTWLTGRVGNFTFTAQIPCPKDITVIDSSRDIISTGSL